MTDPTTGREPLDLNRPIDEILADVAAISDAIVWPDAELREAMDLLVLMRGRLVAGGFTTDQAHGLVDRYWHARVTR